MAYVLFTRFCAANFGVLVWGSCASIFSGLPSQMLPCLLKISSVALPLQEFFLGVVSPFSTALYVPSGFSDKRFETAPDLSLLKHVKTVLAKR